MRYAGAEKLEIIRLVDQSSLSVGRTPARIGIPKSAFYSWYVCYLDGGAEALEDCKPAPRRVCNKLPGAVSRAIIDLALQDPERSRRELVITFGVQKKAFVSEASVYRPLKAHGKFTTPAFILMKAADSFTNPTTARECGRVILIPFRTPRTALLRTFEASQHRPGGW